VSISARVICDSIYDGGPRLTTFVLRYPRFIHSELMTHRVFSRNAASSRAIPIQKMLQSVVDDPAMPVWWGKNQAGMQAREELSDDDWDIISIPGPVTPSSRQQAKDEWLRARDSAVVHVEALMKTGLHKQIANRILEPWAHIEVVLTGTEWTNFYALRNHPDAQPEFRVLAEMMLAAHNASQPRVLKEGQWHLPFVTADDYARYFPNLKSGESPAPGDWLLLKISAARCARVSYLKHDGASASLEEDRALFDRLMSGDVKHASPTEHQAKVPLGGKIWLEHESNLKGWVQFRKLIAGENITSYEGLRNV